MAYYRKNRGTTYTNTGTRGSSGSGSSGSGRTASNYVYPDSYVNSGTGDGATPRGDATPVVTTGNFSTINPLNPYGSSQGDIINQLLKLLGTDNGFAQLLQQLGIQTGNMNAGEIQDWNKQIMDALMQYAITQEQRDYNKSVLDEQRIYDTPTNQLARLMGAGISRDAALQLLSGSGSSGSGGSALIGDPAGLPASAIPGTQSDLNAIQRDTAIANTVFNGVSCLSSLVNLGFSIPQALAQTSLLRASSYLSKLDVDAINSAGDAFSILNAAGSAAEAFGSAATAISAIEDLSKNGNEKATQFIQSGGIDKMRKNAPLVSSRLGSLYRSERGSADYAREYAANMRKMEASAILEELGIDKLSQEIVNCQAEYDNIIADTDYKNALAVTTEALGLKYTEETTALEFQNKETGALFNTSFEGRSYLDWRSADVLNHIVSSAKIAARTTNSEYVDVLYEEMFNSADAVAAAMSLAALKSKSGIEFATKYPQQFQWWSGLDQCGAYQYLDAKVKANTSGDYRLPFGIGGSKSGLDWQDDFDSNNPFGLDLRTDSRTRQDLRKRGAGGKW